MSSVLDSGASGASPETKKLHESKEGLNAIRKRLSLEAIKAVQESLTFGAANMCELANSLTLEVAFKQFCPALKSLFKTSEKYTIQQKRKILINTVNFLKKEKILLTDMFKLDLNTLKTVSAQIAMRLMFLFYPETQNQKYDENQTLIELLQVLKRKTSLYHVFQTTNCGGHAQCAAVHLLLNHNDNVALFPLKFFVALNGPVPKGQFANLDDHMTITLGRWEGDKVIGSDKSKKPMPTVCDAYIGKSFTMDQWPTQAPENNRKIDTQASFSCGEISQPLTPEQLKILQEPVKLEITREEVTHWVNIFVGAFTNTIDWDKVTIETPQKPEAFLKPLKQETKDKKDAKESEASQRDGASAGKADEKSGLLLGFDKSKALDPKLQDLVNNTSAAAAAAVQAQPKASKKKKRKKKK